MRRIVQLAHVLFLTGSVVLPACGGATKDSTPFSSGLPPEEGISDLTRGTRLTYAAASSTPSTTTIESGEMCDGPDLGGNTCATATMNAHATGTLRCAACQLDTSGCI